MRVSAGILFAVALITFMHAFLLGNFQPTRVFVVAYTTRTHALRSCSAQERRTVASGKNRVSSESGKGIKP